MKTTKNIICALIAICILFSFSACKSEKNIVMQLDKAVIDEDAYNYWLCSYKAQFMNQYSDVSDTDEFWNSMLYDDVTSEKFLTDLVNDYVKMNLVSIYLFDEYGMKISADDKKNASDIISDMRDISGGDKKAFEKVLSQYGVNEKKLKQIYLDEYKTTYVYNYVFENGVINVSDDEKQSFLEENYVRIRHIYINDAYDYEQSYYDSDGNFIKIPLSDDIKKEKVEKTDKVRSELSSGNSFDEVYEKYSEEKAYKNGYYICSKTEDLPSELILKSFSLEVGESAEVTTEYGTHFIMRLEMDDGAWKSSANEDFFTSFKDDVYENEFVKFIKSYFDRITVNDGIIEKYSIRDALPNWSYQY